MTARVLVTGGGGFVGQWLARALLERGDDVTLAGLEPPRAGAALGESELRRVKSVPMDVRDDAAVATAIEKSRPDLVFHLAGVAFVPDAEDAPVRAWEANVLGAVRLLSVVARHRRAGTLDPTVLIVGSAHQYGRHSAEDMPLTESAEQRPITIYAATKTAQETAALRAWRAEGVRVVCTRSFNHSGVGQSPQFLLPALVGRALASRASGARTIAIGDELSVRDYLHVEDVVEAYLALSQRGVPGECYNVCSGEGVTPRQLAQDVLLRTGATAEIAVTSDLVREVDVPILVGSPAKLKAATGWAPRRNRDQIIDDLIHAATR